MNRKDSEDRRARILDMAKANYHPLEIAFILCVTRQYVYKILNDYQYKIEHKRMKLGPIKREYREPTVLPKNRNLNYRERQYPFN